MNNFSNIVEKAKNILEELNIKDSEINFDDISISNNFVVFFRYVSKIKRRLARRIKK